MLDELVALQPDQPAVADIAVEAPVLDGGAEALVELFDEHLAAVVVQPADAALLFKILLAQLLFVEQGEDQAVRQQRLENLRQVQRQAEALGARLVQIRDQRVELGAVNFGQAGGVNHAVAEADQRVDHVVRRPLDALGEINFLIDDQRPGAVINLADVALDAHQLPDVPGLVDALRQRRDVVQKRRAILAAAVVVLQVLDDIAGGAGDESARQLQTPGFVELGLHLPDEQIAAVEKFARIEGAGIKAVIIEQMNGDVLLAAVVEKFLVEIRLAENVEAVDVFDGNDFLFVGELEVDLRLIFAKFRFLLQRFLKVGDDFVVGDLLVALEENGVLLAAQAPGVEEVVVAVHSGC